jgi:hypothetical protein
MTYRRAAALGAVSGVAFAVTVAAAVAVRAAFTITRAGRWYQIKQL